jgi:hypothetical protein
MDNNITLKGHPDNNAPLVYVNGSSSKTGGTIYGDTDANPTNGNATDNTATDDAGHAALYVESIIVGGTGPSIPIPSTTATRP